MEIYFKNLKTYWHAFLKNKKIIYYNLHYNKILICIQYFYKLIIGS